MTQSVDLASENNVGIAPTRLASILRLGKGPSSASTKLLRQLGLETRLSQTFELHGLPSSQVLRISNLSPKQVPTCAAAPQHRGTPLSHELKSLILNTEIGAVAVHLPGEKKLSLNRLKRHLGIRDASLMAPVDLPFPPGRVCALAEPVSSYITLVCSSLLPLEFVTTNDSTIHGFFLFAPRLLLEVGPAQTVYVSI